MTEGLLDRFEGGTGSASGGGAGVLRPFVESDVGDLRGFEGALPGVLECIEGPAFVGAAAAGVLEERPALKPGGSGNVSLDPITQLLGHGDDPGGLVLAFRARRFRTPLCAL
jgi:hypothetical protein